MRELPEPGPGLGAWRAGRLASEARLRRRVAARSSPRPEVRIRGRDPRARCGADRAPGSTRAPPLPHVLAHQPPGGRRTRPVDREAGARRRRESLEAAAQGSPAPRRRPRRSPPTACDRAGGRAPWLDAGGRCRPRARAFRAGPGDSRSRRRAWDRMHRPTARRAGHFMMAIRAPPTTRVGERRAALRRRPACDLPPPRREVSARAPLRELPGRSRPSRGIRRPARARRSHRRGRPRAEAGLSLARAGIPAPRGAARCSAEERRTSSPGHCASGGGACDVAARPIRTSWAGTFPTRSPGRRLSRLGGAVRPRWIEEAFPPDDPAIAALRAATSIPAHRASTSTDAGRWSASRRPATWSAGRPRVVRSGASSSGSRLRARRTTRTSCPTATPARGAARVASQSPRHLPRAVPAREDGSSRPPLVLLPLRAGAAAGREGRGAPHRAPRLRASRPREGGPRRPGAPSPARENGARPRVAGTRAARRVAKAAPRTAW